MKKIFLFVMLAGLYVTSFAQHLVPVEISTDPENIEIAVFGAGTIDGGSAAFVESFTSKAEYFGKKNIRKKWCCTYFKTIYCKFKSCYN